jgi:hypothetical protein
MVCRSWRFGAAFPAQGQESLPAIDIGVETAPRADRAKGLDDRFRSARPGDALSDPATDNAPTPKSSVTRAGIQILGGPAQASAYKALDLLPSVIEDSVDPYGLSFNRSITVRGVSDFFLSRTIAKGLGDPAVLGPRSTALDGERKTVAAELAEATPAVEAVALHPAMLARYEEQLTRLSVALADGISDGDTECSEAIRDLVETVTVFRDGARPGGVQVEISGRLTALLGEQAFPNRVKGVW